MQSKVFRRLAARILRNFRKTANSPAPVTGDDLWSVTDYCSPTQTRIYARFIPEAYVCGDVLPINGPSSRPGAGNALIDVTLVLLSLSATDLADLRDPCSGARDALVDARALGHEGPYSVDIETGLREFFDFWSTRNRITSEMLAASRRQVGPSIDNVLRENVGTTVRAIRQALSSIRRQEEALQMIGNRRQTSGQKAPEASRLF